MKTLMIWLSLCLSFLSCGGSEDPEDIVELVDSVDTRPYPEITLENVFDLKPRYYRLKPYEYLSLHSEVNYQPIVLYLLWSTVRWGTRDEGPGLVKIDGFPENVPNIRLAIEMIRRPYLYTKDGKPIFDYEITRVFDELVVSINSQPHVEKVEGHPEEFPFEYTFVYYRGEIIENLTHPDRKIEYE